MAQHRREIRPYRCGVRHGIDLEAADRQGNHADHEAGDDAHHEKIRRPAGSRRDDRPEELPERESGRRARDVDPDRSPSIGTGDGAPDEVRRRRPDHAHCDAR